MARGAGVPSSSGHNADAFLSRAQCGAQDARFFLDPDRKLLDQLLNAARGTVRVITVAPELPGAVQLIEHIVASGAVAAIGHTDATYEQTVAAAEAGAQLVTHLYNGMRPMHHRKPAGVGGALDIDALICEVVADGAHMHDAALRLAYRVKGHKGLALITDAIAAAGMGDGVFQHGGHYARVTNGIARAEERGSIAGSTLTMDAAVPRAAAADLPLADAIRSASQTPAAVLGLSDAGALQVGHTADLVVLETGSLDVHAVMVAGVWIARPSHYQEPNPCPTD